jgi:hypothetical protein
MIPPIVVAITAFGTGPLLWFLLESGNDIPSSNNVALSIWLGWIWIGTFVAALFARGRRALWLLIAAPFALYWPAMWIFAGHACDPLGRCGSFMGLISN